MNLVDVFNENETLLAEWAEDLNTEHPSKFRRSSRKKVWWRCEKGHEWQAEVYARIYQESGCPCCSGLKVIPGETDLATLCPDIAQQWNYERNGDIDPRNVSGGSGKKVWWSCEKGHEWQATVSSRAQDGSGCPYCAGLRVIPGETDLATLCPDIAQQWDCERNGDIDPRNVSAGSHKKVWWRCEKGHSWQTMVISRTQNSAGCPYCSGYKAIPGETDLVTLCHHIAQQWDHERNGDIDPRNVSAFSHKKVWWRCEKGHSWQAMVYARTQNSTGCPYCSGYKAIPGETDLVTLRPDIARQWDCERNGNVAPQNVSIGSHKKVWWRCEKGHNWQAMVYARTKIGTGCPVCAGRKKVSDTYIKYTPKGD